MSPLILLVSVTVTFEDITLAQAVICMLRACVCEVQPLTGWASCWSRPLCIRPDSPLSLPLNPRPLWTIWDPRSAERSLWKQAVILLLRSQRAWDRVQASASERSGPNLTCLQRVRLFHYFISRCKRTKHSSVVNRCVSDPAQGVHIADLSMLVPGEWSNCLHSGWAVSNINCLTLHPSCAVVFISGSSLYKRSPPEGNILLEVCSCIGVSHLPVPLNRIGWFTKVQTDLFTSIYFAVIKGWFLHVASAPVVSELFRSSFLFFTYSLPSETAGRGPSVTPRGSTGWTGPRRSTR